LQEHGVYSNLGNREETIVQTIITTEILIDKIPEGLPITCLRKTDSEVWRLKTANENGVKQTDFKGENLDALEAAIKAYAKLPKLAVGPLVICFDNKSYIGLEPRIAAAFPGGHTTRGIQSVTFPWSAKPKR